MHAASASATSAFRYSQPALQIPMKILITRPTREPLLPTLLETRYAYEMSVVGDLVYDDASPKYSTLDKAH